ncbi:MAG: cobyrinate a,c-diamide synthase [Candidatus Limnocylindrales bacterium]
MTGAVLPLVPRLVVAAPASGSGKSVIATGLMAALAARMAVQAFKVGPDYIDPMYHAIATGRPSRNLDTWMTSREAVVRTFLRATADADIAVVEGVMGLFDGAGAGPLDGTTAEVADLLGAPIVLVIDAARMAGSAAAVVHGFDSLVPGVRVAGVIGNRVGSERHERLLRDALAPLRIPVLGMVPRTPELAVAERHLGLVTAVEQPDAAGELAARARTVAEQHVDIAALLAIAAAARPLAMEPSPATSSAHGDAGDADGPARVRIVVARDEAFSFYYADNLDALRRAGAEVTPFSPLRDDRLPDGAAGLYLGGGYPELYAARLAANAGLLASIRRTARAGMPIYAECGGLMLLTEGLDGPEGSHHLAGLLPGRCTMAERVTLGYREAEVLADGPLARAGDRLRGHEFHYSTWNRPAGAPAAYRVDRPGSSDAPTVEGFASGALLASYVHLHFDQDSRLAARFVGACRAWAAPLEPVA